MPVEEGPATWPVGTRDRGTTGLFTVEGGTPRVDGREGIVTAGPPRAEDFFEWEIEMSGSTEEPSRTVKIIGGVILAMIVAIVLILLGKVVIWAWGI